MPADAFQSALISFSERQVRGSPWRTEQWAEVSAEVRQKSFFSAAVENTRFLQKAKDLIEDFLADKRETLPNGETMLKVGSREDFVQQMREFQIETGMVESWRDFQTGVDESVRDIKSRGRLNLIFDTNTKQAWGFGRYKQEMDPVLLDAFPAWKFVRLPGAETPRPRHVAAENAVRLKTDEEFWLFQNDPEIGGFNQPYGPWGFNSFMTTFGVTRREAEKLGLLDKEEPIPPPEVRSFTDGLRASLAGIADDIKSAFRSWLNKFKRRTERRAESPAATAARLAKDARIKAIMGSLDRARNRGDRAEVSRIARILREEMGPASFARRFNFRMRGGEVEFL